MTIVPKARGPVYNVYGPTEFTVDATYYELEKGREYDNIPIGRPLDNCAAYIVNEQLELLPPGEVGELCMAGPQLAEGYWNRPELTAEKFTMLVTIQSTPNNAPTALPRKAATMASKEETP